MRDGSRIGRYWFESSRGARPRTPVCRSPWEIEAPLTPTVGQGRGLAARCPLGRPRDDDGDFGTSDLQRTAHIGWPGPADAAIKRLGAVNTSTGRPLAVDDVAFDDDHR